MRTLPTVMRCVALWGLCLPLMLHAAAKPNVLFVAIDDLNDWAGLPANPENDGRSFVPLLGNPAMEWDYPTLTTSGYMNHSITDGRYRYTWYGGKADGAEELYDHRADPLEYTNLAYNPEYREILDRLKEYLPEHHEPPSP